MKFPYKTVLLTGASTGIGAEMAVQMAAFGANIALVARREALLEDVAKKVEAAGGKALVLPADVSDAKAMKAAVSHSIEAFGPIELCIANAGIGETVDPLSFDAELVRRTMEVNVLGMTNTFYAALPAMLERRIGHLVGVSSQASYQGMPADGGYSASKAAQRIQMEGMRVELRGSGVRVTCICPGFVRTPMTDKNEFDMPLLLEVDDACRGMLKAIVKQKRVYDFPRRMRLLTRIGNLLPRWLYDRLVASSIDKESKRTQKL